MATFQPLVINNGEIQQLQPGDSLDPSVIAGVGQQSFVSDYNGATSKGMPVYVKSTGNVDLGQANAVTPAGVIGMADENGVAQGSPVVVTSEGYVTVPDWSGITYNSSQTLEPGKVYYLSAANPGKITQVAPNTQGQFVVRLGRAMTTTIFKLDIDLTVKL